jgi:tetratricopeptide (TPR) repeat protein
MCGKGDHSGPIMRRWPIHLLLTAGLLLGQVPFLSPAPALAQAENQAAALDELFAQLRSAPDEARARTTADRIWTIWTQPDEPGLAARMAEIMTGGGFAGPLAQLPQINALIVDYPDYAEGWNLRATANFMRGDYEASLADVTETLKREPRHFGALAGRALILQAQGRHDEALEAIKQALDIHPFLSERALFPELGPPPIRS